jgi:hypothetical protein
MIVRCVQTNRLIHQLSKLHLAMFGISVLIHRDIMPPIELKDFATHSGCNLR